MVRFECQIVAAEDNRVVQEFPAVTFTVPEQAEERAMKAIRTLSRMRSVINFEDKNRLIIDFFEKDSPDPEIFVRRIFSGDREDLFSILRAMMSYQEQIRKENQKPPQ